MKILGLTENKVAGGDFASVKLGVYYNNSPVLAPESTDDSPINLVLTGDCSWSYGDATWYLYDFIPQAGTPISLSDEPDLTVKEFFGPVKFIAIKPKKLVIADDGIAFYTDNDFLKYKNVNRIVTVDLESFSIIDVSLVNVFFNGDDSNIKNAIPRPDSTEAQAAWAAGKEARLPTNLPDEDGNLDTYSYKNLNDEDVTLSDVIFGITCGDGE